MRKFLVLAIFGLVLGMAHVTFAKTLVDVPSGHWAEDAVQRLVDAGLIEGMPDGTYQGDRPLTRYEYAMVVSRSMDLLNETYCTKEECSGGGLKPEELDEIKEIVKKLAAEFKDELAALKVKVDENSAKIVNLEKDIKASRIGNIIITGSVRQRIDVPNTDLMPANFYSAYYGPMYDYGAAGAASTNPNARSFAGTGLAAGYEMVPSLTFSGKAGDNADFSIGFDKSIRSSTLGYDQTANDDQGELVINHAYVDIDFSSTVRELDILKLKSGYQQFDFGPYGMLVDNSGFTSNPAIRLDVGKDVVTVTGIGGLVASTPIGTATSTIQGLGGASKDPYAAIRLNLDLPWLEVGVNFLANGLGQEKGWGADVVIPLLRKTPFLTEMRAEYMTVTDLENGVVIGPGVDDNSFIIGLDLYKNERAGLTLSYADLPATVAMSSMDGSPFTEYGAVCPAGLDVSPTSGTCASYESGRNLFPAGYEGIGVEASYIVFGDVELAAKGFVGNYAGGRINGKAGTDADGNDYPGFGAFSVTKPINDKSTFRVEYAQQGKDPILLNRVRSELLITF